MASTGDAQEKSNLQTEHWRLVEDLYHRALGLHEHDRPAFLAYYCQDDELLRKEVESLLAHDRPAEKFFELPALEVAGKLFANDLTLSTGKAGTGPDHRTIGPYHLVERIGEGGMGEVWLADQTHPIRRRVALKLIRPGLNTREVITRFESERQALALMDHPAVAKVLDGGSTSSGQPYFVMEYVPGLPITDWCDQHKLTLTERLELFIQVCEGVQHAHQKAIIHRDLKPSNILVADVDGKGAPKIIDFGVAKAVSQKLTDETFVTRVGVILGTPEYMSPEQAVSAGSDIDTRSDVYSLGVILYQLLVGASPIDLKGVTFEELLRRLRQDDPPYPSIRLRMLGESTPAAGGNLRTEPKTLARQLRGDLDSIVMKALEKQRARRYAGPADLAADIRRYLLVQPVLARPASIGYRTRKYVARHRLGVTFVGAVVLLLAALAATQTMQLHRIKRERDRADRITEFMTGMFKVSNPSEARGNQMTAREILDSASQKISAGLVKDPELQTQLMQVISTVYLNLGLYSPAASLAQQAFEIRRRVLGPNHPDTLHLRVDVGIARLEQGRIKEAQAVLTPAVADLQRVLGPDHPDTLRADVNLGATLSELGRLKEAEALLRPTVERMRLVLGPENIDTLRCMHNLALALRGQGRYAEEEALDRQTIEIARRTLGPDHPDTLRFMQSLAFGLDGQGRFAEEEPLLRQLIALQQHVLGPDHRDTLMSTNNLATLLMHKGQYAEAESQFRRIREIQRRVLGPDHPDVAVSTYNLACIALLRGDNSSALLLLREAVDHGLTPPNAAGIKDDPDLKRLHADPRFAALLTYIQQHK